MNEGKSALDPTIARKLMSQLARPEAAAASVEPLTEREREVLRLAAKGYTNKASG